MDIKLQFFFCNLVIWNAALDQGKNTVLRIYYEQLGLDNVFNIWWIVFWLDNIGKRGLNNKTKYFILRLSYSYTVDTAAKHGKVWQGDVKGRNSVLTTDEQTEGQV